MRRVHLRMRILTGMLLVAALAIPLSLASNATRRFQFCWEQQAKFASQERRMWANASRRTKRAVHAREAAIAYSHRKWRYRWEAFRFWEPYELIESEPYNR